MPKKRRKLGPFWEKIEHYNAKLIPFALVLLLGIIIFELFLHIENHAVELGILIADYIVIAIFVVDLIFLAYKARTVKFFFKSYWLDILAVVPLVLVFTVVGRIYRAIAAAGKVTIGQAIFHEALEARKGISVLGRSGRFAKYVKIVVRGIRIVTKSRFFTKIIHRRGVRR